MAAKAVFVIINIPIDDQLIDVEIEFSSWVKNWDRVQSTEL